MSTTQQKQPQDHKRKQPSKQRAEAQELDVRVEYDDDAWTVSPAAMKQLDFLAALEDEEYITAMRLLLGRDDAARFFKGRSVEDVGGFFDALGEAADSGNR